jgi:alkanesulfonate monooxygenase SsuD/methylene tetrahydromethanopterin reductase-like flavin-dependent oxidoreductase (luciferase family)
MQIGIDSFVETSLKPVNGTAPDQATRVRDLIEEIELADQVGLDVFGIGEHHRQEFVASSPAVILAAAAARTKRIRLSSAVTVLSSEDPVRVFQQFASLDLISQGRAEIIVGRGSFIESYPLFGFDLEDYDSLFSEKLQLLLKIRDNTHVHWSGKHRAALTGQGVYPRPIQNPFPIRVGVGGTPQSFARAGLLGLPLAVAIIGGEPRRFRPLVDLYRDAGRQAGHSAEKSDFARPVGDGPTSSRPAELDVSIHSVGYIADTKKQAADDFYPPYAEMFGRIGKERGWPPISRAQFDASCGPTHALMVGDPESIAEKILYENEVLGGISRMTILLNGGVISHQKAMHAIELLGTRVAPMVRKELASPVESKSDNKVHGLEKAA